MLCVRSYLRYSLSYPDLEEMMEERRVWAEDNPGCLQLSHISSVAAGFTPAVHWRPRTLRNPGAYHGNRFEPGCTVEPRRLAGF